MSSKYFNKALEQASKESKIYVSKKIDIEERLNEILSFEGKKWYSIIAAPPLNETIEACRIFVKSIKVKPLKLLDVESIVPTMFGVIVFYFEDDDNDLFIQFGDDSISANGEVNGKKISVKDIPFNEFEKIIEIIDQF